MRLREVPPKPVSPHWLGPRDERWWKREMLSLHKNRRKRVNKLRRPRLHIKKGNFIKFKINGMTNDEAREYRRSLMEFITDEKLLLETSDDFSESDEEFSGRAEDKKKTLEVRPVGRKYEESFEIFKRKIGRPAKISRKEDTAKRKVGRPRKMMITKSEVLEKGEETIFKRKAGSPSKTSGKEDKVKRKVGRPREKLKESLEVLVKGLNMECRVVLKRLLPSEIAERLGPRYGNGEKIENRTSSGKLNRSPAKSVSNEDIATTEEEDYLLDEENIRELSSVNNNLPVCDHSPSHHTFADEDDSSCRPVLTSHLASLIRENSMSPPQVFPFQLKENYLVDEIHGSVSTVNSHETPSQPQQTLAYLMPAVNKLCSDLDLICVDWNHSPEPSKVTGETLSDCQLGMVVKALEALTHCPKADPSCPEFGRREQVWDSSYCAESHPGFSQRQINFALHVTNVNCASRSLH